jgi:RNA polymerase sigma-70 factor (ECF subfamily)
LITTLKLLFERINAMKVTASNRDWFQEKAAASGFSAQPTGQCMNDSDNVTTNEPEEALRPMDEAVRRALVEGHEGMLRFLIGRLRNRNDAEEVLQRFMLRAIERANDLRDVKSVKGWLSKVLATTLIDFHRQATRSRMKETVIDPQELAELAEAETPNDEEIEAAVCNCLYRLLPTLKSEYSEVIWRADLLEEPRENIAHSLDTTVNNINVRLYRARDALRQRLLQMCRTCVVHGFLDCECRHGDGGVSLRLRSGA